MALNAVGGEPIFDVAIVGAGVVGCAIAQALSQFELDVVLVEAGDDVGTGTSKANSAILHTGFDAPVGTLEARLVSRGHDLLTSYAASVGIPLIKTGATLVAWRGDDTASLQRIQSTARQNGYQSIAPLTADDVYSREPHLGPGVIGGLNIPDESIICPFTTPLALATEAVANGVTLLLNSPLTSASRNPSDVWRLLVGADQIRADWVINAAGLHGDSVAEMLGDAPFEVQPRRGQFIVFDKSASELASSIIIGIPSPRSKGVLVAPTVFGNLLLGPTAEDIDSKEATENTNPGIDYLLDHGRQVLPDLERMEVTSTYAGLRAVSSRGGYDIAVDREGRYGRAVGIRSTGLSASMAIAEHILDQLAEAGLDLKPRSERRRVIMPPVGDHQVRSHADEAAISADPAAGRVVCFCELTTVADLEMAAASLIPPTSLGGVFRRTRAIGGRCQGFYCRPKVTAWLAMKLGKKPADLMGG